MKDKVKFPQHHLWLRWCHYYFTVSLSFPMWHSMLWMYHHLPKNTFWGMFWELKSLFYPHDPRKSSKVKFKKRGFDRENLRNCAGGSTSWEPWI